MGKVDVSQSGESVTLRAVTEQWVFAVPVEAETITRKRVAVHYVKRTITPQGAVSLAFHGVPLTSKGNPNGVVDYRFLLDSEAKRLGLMLPPWSPLSGRTESPDG